MYVHVMYFTSIDACTQLAYANCNKLTYMYSVHEHVIADLT